MSTDRQPEKKSIRQYIRDLQVLDYRLIVSIVALFMFGLIMIYSAGGSGGAGLLKRQALIGTGGLVGMVLFSYVDYHKLVSLSGAFYLLSILSLFLVRVPGLGKAANGAARWIVIGGQQFQPAELVKPAIILLTAFLVSEINRKLRYIRADLFVLAPGLLAVALILKITSNLSTAAIVGIIVFAMFFAAHPNKKVWIWVLVLLAAGAAFFIMFYRFYVVPTVAMTVNGTVPADSSFRAGRILAWLYPDVYRQTAMQSRYALYAIGFGGMFGRGLGHGIMKYFIPEPENDFIFAVIGEELGFLGCCMLIFMFIYQIWRILVIARHASDMLGSYVAFGAAVHVSVQVLLNIGVATSMLPNTGISLPYVSYGGSALLLQMLEMGIVLNVSRQIPGKRVLDEGGAGRTGLRMGRSRAA